MLKVTKCRSKRNAISQIFWIAKISGNILGFLSAESCPSTKVVELIEDPADPMTDELRLLQVGLRDFVGMHPLVPQHFTIYRRRIAEHDQGH